MFKFRLEPLITIRDNVLKERQGELAQAYEARRITQEEHDLFETELKNQTEYVRQQLQTGDAVNVQSLRSFRQQEMFLRAEIDRRREIIKGIDEVIELRRNEVMLAHRELKIAEKLKEKRKEKYDEEEKRKENTALDEIGTRTVR